MVLRLPFADPGRQHASCLPFTVAWWVPHSRARRCCSWSTSAVLPFPKTIDFTVDYLRVARAEELYAVAEVQRIGKRIANVRMRAYQAAGGRARRTRPR